MEPGQFLFFLNLVEPKLKLKPTTICESKFCYAGCYSHFSICIWHSEFPNLGIVTEIREKNGLPLLIVYFDTITETITIYEFSFFANHKALFQKLTENWRLGENTHPL